MEWKTYNIKFSGNGTLSMTDLYTNKNLFSYTDATKINATYLIVRSKSPALWRIHESMLTILIFSILIFFCNILDYFLYSNVSTVSEFGPPFKIDRTDYCFKLYVSMCKKCSMDLFVYEDEKQRTIANLNGTTVSYLFAPKNNFLGC